MSSLFSGVCVAFLFFFSADITAKEPVIQAEGLRDTPRLTPVVRAVQRILPTVVNISTERLVRISDPFELFFNDFFGRHIGRYAKEMTPLGSGVIVCCEGLVVSNYHVISRASQIMIRLWDGREYTATMVAFDIANDLALLRLEGDLEPGSVPSIAFAAPDDLYLGETVVAVGNPFGLGHTVTEGVLSATNRSLTEGRITFNDILQTSAAINPGNSGGPLINLDGELIGINIAIRRDAEGISFAIPMSRIEAVLARWLVPSRFSLAYCGLIPKTILENGRTAVVVAEVQEDSPAAQAGVVENERIAKVNGRPVARAVDVGRILWPLQAGDILRLEMADGQTREIRIGKMGPEMLVYRRLGIRLQELTPALVKALSLPASLEGLAISQVFPDSGLAEVKARRGDVIVRIGDVPTTTLDDVLRALADKQPGSRVPVYLIAVENVHNQIFLRRFAVNITLN